MSGAGEARELAETLEQYGDRIAAKVRKIMMDRLDDDVIGCISASHVIFGKACAMEAVTTAMDEMGKAALASTQLQPDAGTFHESGDLLKVAEAVKEACARYIEGADGVIPAATIFASLVSGNNMPCMSGDARDRLTPHKRRQFDDATRLLAASIRALDLAGVKGGRDA